MRAQQPAAPFVRKGVFQRIGDELGRTLNLSELDPSAAKLVREPWFERIYALFIPPSEFIVRNPLQPPVNDRSNVTRSFTNPRKFDLFFFLSTFRWPGAAHGVR